MERCSSASLPDCSQCNNMADIIIRLFYTFIFKYVYFTLACSNGHIIDEKSSTSTMRQLRAHNPKFFYAIQSRCETGNCTQAKNVGFVLVRENRSESGHKTVLNECTHIACSSCRVVDATSFRLQLMRLASDGVCHLLEYQMGTHSHPTYVTFTPNIITLSYIHRLRKTFQWICSAVFVYTKMLSR